MRAVGAVLVLLLAALPAGARRAIFRQTGATAKPRAQPSRSAPRQGAKARPGWQPAAARKDVRRRRARTGAATRATPLLADRLAAPVRSRLVRRLQRPGQWRVQRQDHGRHQDVPARSQVQGNRRPQPAGARPAGSCGEGQAGAGRLEHGRRSRHRCAHRASDQAGPQQERRPRTGRAGLRRKARSRSRPSDQGARHHARGGLRATEERTGDAASSRSTSCAPTSSSCRACRA